MAAHEWRVYWDGVMLTPVRFDRNGAPQEAFYQFAALKARCVLPYWARNFSFEMVARNRADAYERWTRHQGDSIALIDSFGNVILQGDVRNVQKDGRFVRYEVDGTEKRHADERYTTKITPSTTVSDAMVTVLNAVTPAVYADAANFEANASQVQQVAQIVDEVGITAGELIKAVLTVSVPLSYTTYDYWVTSRGLARGQLRTPAAYYKKRVDSGAAAWYLGVNDLLPADVGQHIYQYASQVTVLFDWLVGTHDGSSNVQNLTDSTVDFIVEGARQGDVAANVTQGWTAAITGFSLSNTRANMLPDGFPATEDWDNGDVYAIHLKQPATVTVSDTASLWTAEAVLDGTGLSKQQATQLANNYLSVYSKPVFQDSFSIGSPMIRHRSGGRWPLWYLLVQPTMVHVRGWDEMALFGQTAWNSNEGVWTTAVDFDYDRMTASVTPNLPPDTLADRLADAGIIGGTKPHAPHRGATGAGSSSVSYGGGSDRGSKLLSSLKETQAFFDDNPEALETANQQKVLSYLKLVEKFGL